MDRDEALKLLKGGPEGIKEWNRRRSAGEEIPDLSSVNLRKADMADVNLDYAKLQGASLNNVNLRRASLRNADFSETDLSESNLQNADLTRCIIDGSSMEDTDLNGATLYWVTFHKTILCNTIFNDTRIGSTIFASDLSEAIGLNKTRHWGNSAINVNSILSFKDDLPEKFLRGCGLRDEEIAYFRAQIGKPIRFYTCFISYNTADEEFASRLHNDFQEAGIRCWKWNEDARTGKSMWGEIDHAIRKFNKLVLIASESSLKSPYVGDEIERALQKERNLMVRKHKGEYDGETDVLFPVRIDDYIFDGWEHERKPDVTKKVIADACGWNRDNDKYQKMRDKLIADLKKQSDL